MIKQIDEESKITANGKDNGSFSCENIEGNGITATGGATFRRLQPLPPCVEIDVGQEEDRDSESDSTRMLIEEASILVKLFSFKSKEDTFSSFLEKFSVFK